MRKRGNVALPTRREADDASRWSRVCEQAGLTRERRGYAPTPLGELCWRIYSEVAAACLRRLTVDRTPAGVQACVGVVYRATESYLAMLPTTTQINGRTFELACRRGCSPCCSIRVTTTVPYVLAMARAIRRSRADLSSAIDQYLHTLAPLVPCPLLNHDECSFYASRPPSCRGCHSFDAAECRKTSDSRVPQSSMRVAVQQAASAGFDDALAALGLDAEIVDFIPALEIALKEDRCAERWLAGENPFHAAKAC